MLAFAGTRIAQPLLLREIIIYISDTSGLPAYRGYLFAIGLTICSIIQAIVHQQAFFRNQRV
ncbi:unnamed protein product, partial [Rotaria socialis]